MRHADKRYPNMSRYIGTTALALYQAVQSRAYEVGNVIVGFGGNRGRHALLLGAWRVDARMATSDALQRGLLEQSFEVPGTLGTWFHHLTELDNVTDLRLRLEVEWGKELAWRRVLTQKSLYPCTFRADCPVPFEGLSNVSLVMSELRIILDDVKWRNGLSSVSGVYLITDERTGQHYVGSASGGQGIFQRWADYSRSGHGDNQALMLLLESDPKRQSDFRFTLLETFPLDTSRAAAVHRENHWKRALGSRRFGMNLN
jgi:hypothetical protein